MLQCNSFQFDFVILLNIIFLKKQTPSISQQCKETFVFRSETDLYSKSFAFSLKSHQKE